MAKIICDPSIATAVAECEVVKKIVRCCDVFGRPAVEVRERRDGWLDLVFSENISNRFQSCFAWPKVESSVPLGRMGWIFADVFGSLTAEFPTLHDIDAKGYWHHQTAVGVRVFVGSDALPAVRVHWSDAGTHLSQEWIHSDREAVDMAAAACRQPGSGGIYLDWLEERLGVCLRDRDEMMRFIFESQPR